MFLAVRELRFARGRFALMGAVIALIAVLVVLLSGLASGLVNDGVSGLKAMPVSAFAFGKGTLTDNAFSRSTVDDKQLAVWQNGEGVEVAEPMGVSIVNGTTNDSRQVDLTLFGVQPSGYLAPMTSSGAGLGAPDGIVVSETAKDNGVALGTVVTLDRSGVELRVVGFTEGQATFGHVDVAYVPLATWQLIQSNPTDVGVPTSGRVAAGTYHYASAIAIKAKPDASVDMAALDAKAGTMSMTRSAAFNASPGYQAETMTLSMIQAFLYTICALIVGAFFSIWTIQRTQEIAILRAVGASAGYLMRDSIAQAAILLVAFTAVGVAIGIGLGAVMPDAMPFSLEAVPIALASTVTITLGLLGAVVAVVRIARIDPLAALGGQR